jgi:hypothetical protein
MSLTYRSSTTTSRLMPRLISAACIARTAGARPVATGSVRPMARARCRLAPSASSPKAARPVTDPEPLPAAPRAAGLRRGTHSGRPAC